MLRLKFKMTKLLIFFYIIRFAPKKKLKDMPHTIL